MYCLVKYYCNNFTLITGSLEDSTSEAKLLIVMSVSSQEGDLCFGKWRYQNSEYEASTDS
jgi:hypothetical protein